MALRGSRHAEGKSTARDNGKIWRARDWQRVITPGQLRATLSMLQVLGLPQLSQHVCQAEDILGTGGVACCSAGATQWHGTWGRAACHTQKIDDVAPAKWQQLDCFIGMSEAVAAMMFHQSATRLHRIKEVPSPLKISGSQAGVGWWRLDE